MTNDIRKFMKLIESATLVEKDLPIGGFPPNDGEEKDVPLANMPRDASVRDGDGRVAHSDVSYEIGADKVIATLKSYNSQVYTKLAQKLQRIEELEAEVKKLKEETKEAVRGDVADLFGACDNVRTRVIETNQFIFQMTKDPKATEAPKYKDILEELSKSLTPQLTVVLEGLKKTMVTVTQKSAALKLTQKTTEESVNEGIMDTISGYLATFVGKVKAWASKYDGKLAALKAQAGLSESQTLDGVKFVEDDTNEGVDYGRVTRIEKQVDFMANAGRPRDVIVANITSKMGEEEGEHAATYYDAIHGGVKEAVGDVKVAKSPHAGMSGAASPFGEKYRNTKVSEAESEIGDEEVEGQEEVTEDDVDTDEDRIMREYEETMAFTKGATVYCGSRSGKLLGVAPSAPDAFIVELPGGERAAFKKKDCTTKAPGMMKKAASWMVGEDELEDDKPGLTEWDDDYDDRDDRDDDREQEGRELNADAKREADEEAMMSNTDWADGDYDVEVPFTNQEAFLKFVQIDTNSSTLSEIKDFFGEDWEAISQNMTVIVRGNDTYSYKGTGGMIDWGDIENLDKQLASKLAPFVDQSLTHAKEGWADSKWDPAKEYGMYER